jgi:hypothetical protein
MHIARPLNGRVGPRVASEPRGASVQPNLRIAFDGAEEASIKGRISRLFSLGLGLRLETTCPPGVRQLSSIDGPKAGGRETLKYSLGAQVFRHVV